MADYQSPRAEKSSSSAMKRKKKRKLMDLEKKHEEMASKSSRIRQSDGFVNESIEEDMETTTELLQDSIPWRNLQLVLSLQKKTIDIEKKVELAHKFVKLSSSQVADDTTQSSEAVSFERAIIFLNNWVQSTLISSEKEIRVEVLKPQYGVSGSCLDYRCWEILKFCLEEGTKLHVSMSFARDILKVLQCIARNMEIKDLNDDEVTLYDTMLDCVSAIFTSHGGVSNESLDLWILLVDTLLELVLEIITSKLDCSKTGTIILNWTCLVLQPFTKFLRLHPNRKNGFHDFVDRLLEPLLCLLHVLPPSVLASKSAWMSKLLKLIEEVLTQGLFHPSHIDGFLTLQSLAKYKLSDDGKPKDSKTVIKSYHRHLFDRLGRIAVEKKALALFGEGGLFRLYVRCIKRQEGVEVTEGCSKLTDDFSGEMFKRSSGSHNELHHVSALNAEIRKSLFDFFVQIMEPFLGDIDAYLQDEVEVGSVLEDVHCTLKSTNSVLVSLMQEKVYVRVDDTSEGACANFLKLICDKISLLSAKVGQLVPSTFDVNSGTCKELVEVVAKELILCLHYLLEIDYEVLGSDLESLWLLMFSYGTLGHPSTDLQDKLVVIPEILHLGCHMINLYSELRQVGTSVFALCKAIRCMVSSVRDIEADHSESWRSYHESWTKSLRLIICSPELRLSIHNAVKSIPEGQVSLSIRELATDLSKSLEWMKGNSPLSTESGLENSCEDGSSSSCFHLKAEVLGSGLSEVYALVLDSLMVTTGNSSLVGVSLNALMTVIRPSMSILITQPRDGVYEFLSVVFGRKFSNQVRCKDETLPAHWLFLFFFRLYMSCRSSYRQAVSLAPPATSEKMSKEMRDSSTAYSGNDWLEKTEKDKGYFSWIVKRPASLLLTIEAISGICSKESLSDLSPLTYVMNAMTLQRLVDLNRLINSFEFLLKRNEMIIAKANKEDGTYSKQNKRLRKCLTKLAEEATGLTSFMMGHLSLLSKCQPNYPSAEDEWNFAVAAIDKKSLPSAFWYIICQNIDIWSTHAAKKKLKMFLSLLLQNSLPHLGSNFKQFGELNANKAGGLKTVTPREISLELLSNTMLYEEKFVRRHMASRFCRFLDELVSPLFSNGVDIELQSQPNWPEVLSSLTIPSVVSNIINVVNDGSSREPSFSLSIRKSCSEQEVDLSSRMMYTICQSSLNFLCWMPRRCISSKSFSLYATCILNLERLLVGTLLGNNDAPSLNDQYELLQLLLCCRKTLKHLMVTFCEENMEVSQKSLGAIHFGGEFPALWLLKSLLSVQHAFSKDGDAHVKDMMFSLMDYTSYVFLTLIKGSLTHASHYLISAREAFPQKAVSGFDQEDSGHSRSSSCLDQSERIDACNFMIHVAEALKDQSQVMITSKKETIYCGTARGFADVYNLQKLSSIISCFQGFLWGLSSTLCHMDTQNSNLKAIFLRRNFEPVDKLKLCIDSYTTFINNFLCELILQDDKGLKILSDSQASPVRLCNEDLLVAKASSVVSPDSFDISDHREAKTSKVLEKRFSLENVDMGSMYLNNSFLRSLVDGENLEAAFFLRQLFIAYSALLRLNLQIKTSLSLNLVNTFIGISEILLLEFSNNTGTLSQFTFVFLDGIGKFLEEFANHLSLTNPTLPINVYARFIDLHLKAIGKCISLQGKVATLESHETESSMKTMNGPLGFSECAYSSGPSSLDELKSRLRMSFKVFVRKPSVSYISSAVQSIKKALIGLQKGSMVNYQIYTGSSGGGEVSSVVAAGIDCFDLVLEAITGRKNLSTVKMDILGSVSCLFNIITHLQGPGIFYKDPVLDIHYCADPDPGSVVLMCIEVLTKVSGKHALYQMDACYVAQALSIPATLFQNILHHRTSEASAQSAFLMFSDTETKNESMNAKLFDRQYSIELYAACCRMLYTFLRHHKSCVVWGVQEGAKCGAFLRRIYEEIRQQKDVLGQYCRLFLSSYIVVYSGCGPLKVGIKREVDEALRPGVYALVDACSPDDLQYIHTVLGEGPCRNTLANLQHDYKLNFQYEGKV
ncbi:Nucleolar 27S pre-rRNA processing, Urb2/Npa2, C-terminal [Cynara cardunculus var. scolymus]|uniref:Nucleolar 27S pre-rRNA processing, Urb2/Npa2, C-terminal n=1 Tax=Cynara cardunculus var. scolymus TaxID=59895 RepID=A0A103Y7T9_CYNCS|nr:Nucleolar 27S pre-rRNA processing, Urb2/Npa2, C-terminal [Cynara cardunculus var. scolymus]